MNPYTTDTTAEAEAFQIQLIRDMQPGQRAGQALAMSARLVRECKAAIRRNHPEFSEQEIGLAFIEFNYGKPLADQVREYFRNQTPRHHDE